MTNDDLLIDVLRAAGHTEAADLAEKLQARTAEKPEQEPESPADPATPAALSPAEAARQAEGAMMRDAFKRAFPDRFAA